MSSDASSPCLQRTALILAREIDRRRRRDRLAHYRPYARQREFHDAGAEHRERLFMAGNQLGKTLAGSFELAAHLTGRYPGWWRGRRFDAPGRYWAAGETRLSTRDTVQKLLIGVPEQPECWGMGAIPGDTILATHRAAGVANAIDAVMVAHVAGGASTLLFKAYEQGRGKWQFDPLTAHHFLERGAMAAGIRADQLLLDRGLVESRARGQALILAGLVFSGERKIEKAGQSLKVDAPIEVRGRDHPWVSRGGVKLAHGLSHFGFDVDGAVAIDVGSSTGGFTDVLLTKGAARVYAVDSGTNQLAWKLRQDSRVIVLEQTNARYLTADHIPESVDVIVCDASFISLTKVLSAPMGFAKEGARMIALIKPQFEAGRDEVGKGGVVRDPAVHDRVCAEAVDWIEAQGWRCVGVTQSPITGPEGNVEFLMGAEKPTPARDGSS